MKPIDLDQFVGRYLAGESASKLSKEAGVACATFITRLREAGIETRTHAEAAGRYSSAHYRSDEIVRLYLSGESTFSLAERFGVSRGGIRSVLTKAGVALRTGTEREKLKWSRMTPAQRRNQIKNAHRSTKGRTKTLTHQINEAKTRCRKVAPVETELAYLLRSRGWVVDQQTPIGPYNVDISLEGFSIAVELEWGWPMADWRPRFSKRLKYLLDQGWAVLYVIGTRITAQLVVDEVISWFELARRDESTRGKYGMIDCRAQNRTPSRSKFHGFPRVPGF